MITLLVTKLNHIRCSYLRSIYSNYVEYILVLTICFCWIWLCGSWFMLFNSLLIEAYTTMKIFLPSTPPCWGKIHPFFFIHMIFLFIGRSHARCMWNRNNYNNLNTTHGDDDRTLKEEEKNHTKYLSCFMISCLHLQQYHHTKYLLTKFLAKIDKSFFYMTSFLFRVMTLQ